MDAFLIKKKRKLSDTVPDAVDGLNGNDDRRQQQHDESNIDEKLAILSSIFEDEPTSILLEALHANQGSIEDATNSLLSRTSQPGIETKARFPGTKISMTPGIQSSLSHLRSSHTSRPSNSDQTLVPNPSVSRLQPSKGQTLTLYDPASIAALTPCTIIHNFLPAPLAAALLSELLPETSTYTSLPLKVFDHIVRSPHTACFYVDDRVNPAFITRQHEYLYNGSSLGDVRPLLPVMRQVQAHVHRAVNEAIHQRIATQYPHGRRLRYMSRGAWEPNAAFVNCYDGPRESVGYHTDQLTYLGPHPVIGSLSLGVQREFRIRRIVHKTETEEGVTGVDGAGQISIPLPHNSLLIMHAEMQEGWKHAVVPASSARGGITPHPLSGRKRINITYRWYRPEFGPEMTPSCRCGVKCVLKYVRGKYCWICQTPGMVVTSENGSLRAAADGKGCGWFGKAEFDDEGRPVKGKNSSAPLGQIS